MLSLPNFHHRLLLLITGVVFSLVFLAVYNEYRTRTEKQINLTEIRSMMQQKGREFTAGCAADIALQTAFVYCFDNQPWGVALTQVNYSLAAVSGTEAMMHGYAMPAAFGCLSGAVAAGRADSITAEVYAQDCIVGAFSAMLISGGIRQMGNWHGRLMKMSADNPYKVIQGLRQRMQMTEENVLQAARNLGIDEQTTRVWLHKSSNNDVLKIDLGGGAQPNSMFGGDWFVFDPKIHPDYTAANLKKMANEVDEIICANPYRYSPLDAIEGLKKGGQIILIGHEVSNKEYRKAIQWLSNNDDFKLVTASKLPTKYHNLKFHYSNGDFMEKEVVENLNLLIFVKK